MNGVRCSLWLKLKRHLTEDVHKIKVSICSEELGLSDIISLNLFIHAHTRNICDHVVSPRDSFVCALPISAETSVVCHSAEIINIVNIRLVTGIATFHSVIRSDIAENPQSIAIQ